jgi:cell division protein FtsB
MDFRIKLFSEFRGFRFRTTPSRQDGLRLVTRHGPKAEAWAASCVERLRPFLTNIFGLRRKLATFAVALLAGLLFVRVMFDANGMVAYKEKRAEYQSLQKKVLLEQKENDLYTQQIQGLKTDEKAIEKEAREQLHYARPGEYVYVPPPLVGVPPVSHSAKR